MEEKVLVKNEQWTIKDDKKAKRRVFIITAIIGYIVFDLCYMGPILDVLEGYWSPGGGYYAMALLYGAIVGCVAGFLVSWAYVWLLEKLKATMVVTDKRVYGQTAFGKRVDLPIDSISAIGTGTFKRLTVATSSGRISFILIKNRDEIQKCISDLLIDRQQKARPAATEAAPAESNADELKKYKDLLDSGVISQEEFDAKKKQLLGV